MIALDFNKSEFRMVAKTFKGLENVLADELKSLKAKNVEAKNRAVEFTGDIKMLYRANYYLRTALRILVPVFHFTAKNEQQFYQHIAEYDWLAYIKKNTTFAIDSVVNSSIFTHSKYIALKTKDAIVDQIRKETGRRPSVDIESPDIRLHLHVNEDHVDVLLDSSGDSLHRRGYRLDGNTAPLNEVLAAGLIQLSGWEKNCDFIDPMCGSGTLVLEAALLAYNIPPGTFRSEFGFERWENFDQDMFVDVAEEIPENNKFNYKIMGSDLSQKAIFFAEGNRKRAFLDKKVEYEIKDFKDTFPTGEKGLIITNPPYGERIKQENLNALYKNFGDHLKRKFQNHVVWLLSSNKDALKNMGLKTTRKITLFNGPLEVKYQRYEIYKGTKKKK